MADRLPDIDISRDQATEFFPGTENPTLTEPQLAIIVRAREPNGVDPIENNNLIQPNETNAATIPNQGFAEQSTETDSQNPELNPVAQYLLLQELLKHTPEKFNSLNEIIGIINKFTEGQTAGSLPANPEHAAGLVVLNSFKELITTHSHTPESLNLVARHMTGFLKACRDQMPPTPDFISPNPNSSTTENKFSSPDLITPGTATEAQTETNDITIIEPESTETNTITRLDQVIKAWEEVGMNGADQAGEIGANQLTIPDTQTMVIQLEAVVNNPNIDTSIKALAESSAAQLKDPDKKPNLALMILLAMLVAYVAYIGTGAIVLEKLAKSQ